MTTSRTVRIGKRGTVTLPAGLRRALGLEAGSLAVIEEREGGLLLRSAVAVPVEMYSDKRKAEFLLSNATDERDYQAARRAAREMGLDPDEVEHARPNDN